MRNVTSVGKYLLKPVYWFRVWSILLYGAIGIVLLANHSQNSGPPTFALIFLGWSSAGIMERFVRSKRYGLQLELNSGGASRLLASKNESLINQIILAITDVLEREDEAQSYTFNISDGDIINQTGNFENGVQMSGPLCK
jgi:hypothetical protein